MWSMMLAMSLVSQNEDSPLVYRNSVAINTCTVTRNVMKLLVIMSRMVYSKLIHTCYRCDTCTYLTDMSLRVTTWCISFTQPGT
jgi:hypothetical protein